MYIYTHIYIYSLGSTQSFFFMFCWDVSCHIHHWFVNYFYEKLLWNNICYEKCYTKNTDLTWQRVTRVHEKEGRETVWEVTESLRTQQGPHAEFFFWLKTSKSSLTFLWHHVQMHKHDNFDFGKSEMCWKYFQEEGEEEKKKEAVLFFQTFFLTWLYIWSVIVYRMMNLKVNFLPHEHIKLSEN